MDITEHRLPQDGRAQLHLDERNVDLRVSIIPTVVGESVVIRVLDKGVAVRSLDGLGFDERDLSRYRHLMKRPQGMVLVTGPTGSGKTTTLYATLQEVRAEVPRPHIITVEDPVEYEIPDVNQIQVKPKIGFNFAAALRNIVRHDPDVILVGEIRDVETAALAVQAALTGHRVLSTFHTNDAPSALTRLIDMEVEPFLIASCVLGVLGQRLVRVICRSCKQHYTPDAEECRSLGIEPSPELRFYRGVGCKECGKTGYHGRAAVYEFLFVDEGIRHLIIERASSSAIKAAATQSGMRTMPENLVAKVREGVTTAEEALRLGLIEAANGYG
jgi:type II secretory ATPase GspE/PulE/Tfp pilus assembly ATPase PilB-like protein